MQLESALHSSREGLTSQGQAISVVGDNISNSNTTGYKRSRTEFSDLFSAQLSGGAGDANISGGGAMVNTVRQIHEGGELEDTGRSLDVGIDGEGFFIVRDGEDDYYTRAGGFTINSEGLLVDSSGKTVLGYAPGTTEALTTINMKALSTSGKPTTAVTLTGNLSLSDPVGTPPTNPASTSAINASGAASFVHLMSVYDTLGKAHPVMVAFTKTDAANRTWTVQAFMDGGEISGGTAGKPVLIGTLTGLKFNTNGSIDAASQATSNIAVSNLTYADGAAAGNFNINVGQFTQFSTTSIVNSVTNDGEGTGNISQYEIGKDGTITAVLDTGLRKSLGTIALAKFINVDGLQRVGSATFSATNETGTRTDVAAGSSGLGSLKGGTLERSNVDIADQFVELVLFQRAYQANSQMLSAASTLLRDTVGLIR